MDKIRCLLLAFGLLLPETGAALNPGRGQASVSDSGLAGDLSTMRATAAGASASQTFGAWLTSFVFGSPTATALRSFPVAIIQDGAIVYASGYHTAGDGGGGYFYWAERSTETDDGIVSFAPKGAREGRWLRIMSGSLPILATGATCVGGDDTTQVQAGLDVLAALGGGELQVQSGTHCKLTDLRWSSINRLVLRGVGSNAILISNSATRPILTATAGYVDISDMTVFAAAGFKTAGDFFTFSGCSCTLARITFFNGYNLASWGLGSVSAAAVDIVANAPRHDGFNVDVSPPLPGSQYGIALFSRLRLQGDASTTGDALVLVSGDTVVVSDSNLAGFNHGVVARTRNGAGYLANLFFSNVLVDNAGGPQQTGDGWLFDGTHAMLTRINIVNSWSSGMGAKGKSGIGGRGMRFTNVGDVTVYGMRVINSGLDGVLFDKGANRIGFYGGTVSGNSASLPGQHHGLVAAGNDITIKDTRSGPSNNNVDGSQQDTQSCGIIVLPSTTDYRIESNDLRGNTAIFRGAPVGLCDNGGGTAKPAVAAVSTDTKFVSGNRIGRYAP